MPMLPTLLVLCSACLHAAWNVLFKRARDPEAATLAILAVSALVTGAMVPWLPGPAFPDRGALLWGLCAGLGEGCYFLTLGRALRAAPLGWSYAWMRGLGMLLVWPVSLLCMGEHLRARSALSVGVVCLGLLVMGLVAERGRGLGSVAWSAGTGVFIAGYTLCYKAALGHGAQPAALYCLAMLVALLFRAGRRPDPAARVQWGLVLAAGAVCTASFLSYLWALSLGGAGTMATLRNTSIVFAVLFSRATGERPTARQWLGAALVTAGALGLLGA